MASKLNVSRKTLSKILNEKGAVTPDMALRLPRAFGTTPELWLNLQKKTSTFGKLRIYPEVGGVFVRFRKKY